MPGHFGRVRPPLDRGKSTAPVSDEAKRKAKKKKIAKKKKGSKKALGTELGLETSGGSTAGKLKGIFK